MGHFSAPDIPVDAFRVSGGVGCRPGAALRQLCHETEHRPEMGLQAARNPENGIVP